MKYNFSAQFLKIQNPDTSFGEAWESLCFDLLKAEYSENTFRKLTPPDKGIDILMEKECLYAIQCKSNENGANGSISSDASIDSLRTAISIKDIFSWKNFIYATNAYYTGNSTVRILEVAKELGLKNSNIKFWEADYWSELCEKHIYLVKHRFDYRLLFSEQEVIEAFKKAKYFDEYITEYREKINKTDFTLKVKNNRTPLEIEFPFSPDLTVEHCVDVVQNLLGISLDWTNFNDLGTSAGPSISLTINKYAQSFSKKISELDYNNKDNLELWIKIIWKDKLKDKGFDDTKLNFLTKYHNNILFNKSNINLNKKIDTLSMKEFNRNMFEYEDRGKISISREEKIIQDSIWKRTIRN